MRFGELGRAHIIKISGFYFKCIKKPLNSYKHGRCLLGEGHDLVVTKIRVW